MPQYSVYQCSAWVAKPWMNNDLGRLIEFQSAKLQVPVTCMGMGPAGRFSRIVLSGFGAPLCYGWLGKQQVPGQWPALKLAGVLSEVLPV